MLFLHNLADRAVTIDLGKLDGVVGRPSDVFTDADYPPLGARLTGIALNGWGYRWIRLRRSNRD
jgi:maltose alpha-D-glucosyltransferase/alpha-amylase